MPIVVSAPQPDPAPEGLHQAVCCDVIDLGDVEDTFAKSETPVYKHKIRIVWQLDCISQRNYRYTVMETYTASLHEKSKLRKHLTSWRGRSFTEEEKKAFDIEKLIGVNCQIQVVHNGNYANIQAIVPLGKGVETMTVLAYTRKKDRNIVPDDSDVPF